MMKTILAVVGGLTLLLIFFRFILPPLIGFLFPLYSGKALLKKYLIEYGVDVSTFPDQFLQECANRAYKVALALGTGTRLSTMEYYDGQLQGVAVLVCQVVLDGDIEGVDKSMLDMLARYGVYPRT